MILIFLDSKTVEIHEYCIDQYQTIFQNLKFSPFSIAITSLGEERANLSAFRTFVRFVLV